MSNHTKGEWFPVQYGPYWNIQNTPNYDDGINLLNQEECTEHEANAKLAAAAPDMLEVLEKIQVAAELAIHGGSNDLYKFCELVMLNTRPAIKKATE